MRWASSSSVRRRSTSAGSGRRSRSTQGTPAAALAIDLQVFQFAEALVQLANGRNGLVASVPLGVPGLINLSASARVIEPPQLSAVGDPALAKREPHGANAIVVRTAQVRTLLTVELPALGAITALTNELDKMLEQR